MHSIDTAALSAKPATRGKLSLHPLFRDFGLTAFTELGVLVSGLAIVSLMGRLLGVAALGEYLLLRRVLAWLQPAVQLGMGNALPRYVAYDADGPPGQLRRYLAVSVILSGGLAALLAFILYFGRGTFARWLFGSVHLQSLILPLGLLILGLTIHGSAYGYFRGRLALIQANALQICNLVFLPVIVVIGLAKTQSVALIVGATGLATLFFSTTACTFLLRRSAAGPLGMRGTASKLLRYGVPRVPGDFALGGLLALGPLVAMHFVPISSVTCLLLGISILSAVNASSTPVGTLMLSKVSMMLSQERHSEVRVHLRHLLAATIDVSVFVTIQLIVFADVMLRLWVGPRFDGRAGVARIILLAVPFFLIYGCLRSSVDAASITAYNTSNIFISCMLFIVLLGGVVVLVPRGLAVDGVAVSLVTAFVMLAWLTVRTTRKLFGLGVPWRECTSGLLIGFILTGATFAARLMAGNGALALPLITSLAFVTYLLILKMIGTQWLSFFLDVALQRARSLSVVGCQFHDGALPEVEC